MYCRAALPRSGLGNRLFPWARCRVFSHMHNVEMISPTWAQLKIGHFLRREVDMRLYHNLFLRKKDDVSGFRMTWLQAFTPDTEEPRTIGNWRRGDYSGDRIVRFDGLRDYFCQLNGWDMFLGQELRAITRRRWLRAVDELNDI